MNEEIFDLFEKQAAYEGVDLDALSDDELAYVFENFVGNLESEYDNGDDEEVYEYDEEEEAYEKLAEAEILGRHMARAYMDELEKEAKAEPKRLTKNDRAYYTGRMRELLTGHQAAGQRAAKRIKAEASITDEERKAMARIQEAKQKDGLTRITSAKDRELAASGVKKVKKHKSIARAERLKGYGKRGLAVSAAGGLAYGAKKMMDKEAANEAIYNLAFDRAEEFLKEGSIADYDGSTIDNLAIEVLEDHGYVID